MSDLVEAVQKELTDAYLRALAQAEIDKVVADELVLAMEAEGFKFYRSHGEHPLPVLGRVKEKPADTWESIPKDLRELWSIITVDRPVAPKWLGECLKAKGLKVTRDPDYLRPCANCGARGAAIPSLSGHWRIQCDGCAIRTMTYANRSTASEVWNRREPKP